MLVMGALTAGGAADRLGRPAPTSSRGRRSSSTRSCAHAQPRSRRACTSSSTPAWVAWGRATRRSPTRAGRTGAARAAVQLVGLMTHFATADERGDYVLRASSSRASAHGRSRCSARHPEPDRHAANSAATLRDPATHLDLVRCGVAVYGLDPFGAGPAAQRSLRPALHADLVGRPRSSRCATGRERRLRAAVRRRARHDIATVPIGYGDGWRRGLTNNADVLIGGRRFPLVGTVEHGQHHRRSRPGRRRRARRRRPSAARARRDERILAEEVAPRWARSTTR